MLKLLKNDFETMVFFFDMDSLQTPPQSLTFVNLFCFFKASLNVVEKNLRLKGGVTQGVSE